MAFEMSLPRTKRVKHVDMAGNETFTDGDRWGFLRALETAQQKAAEAGSEIVKEEEGEEGEEEGAGGDGKGKNRHIGRSFAALGGPGALHCCQGGGGCDPGLDRLCGGSSASGDGPGEARHQHAAEAGHAECSPHLLQGFPTQGCRGAHKARGGRPTEGCGERGAPVPGSGSLAVQMASGARPPRPCRALSISLNLPLPQAADAAADSAEAPRAGAPTVPSQLLASADVVRDPSGHLAVVLDDPEEPGSPGDPSGVPEGTGDAMEIDITTSEGAAPPSGPDSGGELPTRRTRSTFLGLAASNEALQQHMTSQLWEAWKAALERDLTKVPGGGPPGTIAVSVVKRLRRPNHPSIAALAATMLLRFLTPQLKPSGVTLRILPDLSGWVAHRCAVQSLHQTLYQQALLLHGVRISWICALPPKHSSLLVEVTGRGSMILTCRGETLLVEDLTPRPGEPVAQALARSAWEVSPADLRNLLSTAVRLYSAPQKTPIVG
eukprot:jgi/Botrbrau1/10988/Bobra.0234s0013.1